MGIEASFNAFHRWLDSWPGAVLSVVLVVAAVILVSIAIRGSSTEKAIAAAYVFFP